VSPILCQTDLRITMQRGHKFPPGHCTKAPFIQYSKNRMAFTVDRNRYSIQGIIQALAHRASLMTKTTLIFPAFSLRFVDFAVHFCCRCKFSFYGKPFKSSLTVAWFSWTNRNSLLCIVTNEIAFASLCIDNRIRPMAFFMFAKVGKGRLSNNDERFWNVKTFLTRCFHKSSTVDL